MNTLFPVFLKLEQLHTLIVGGGYVGLEKITALLENSPEARITLVAPEIREEIKQIAIKKPGISLIERKFFERDLQGKDLVIVATNNKLENARIKALATTKRLLTNVADTPNLCDFYLGAIVKKGELKLAISTNGKSPTVAKRLKEVLQETIPEESINEVLFHLMAIRQRLSGDFAQKVEKLNEITRLLVAEGNNFD